MTRPYVVTPARQPLAAQVRPPGSKSLTNRALACAALADGPSELTGALPSEDTAVMISALRELGITITANADHTHLSVGGRPNTPLAQQLRLDIANSGTTVRFLAALLATQPGTFELDGTSRMQERPIQDLLDALAQLGGTGTCLRDNGCPPVRISGSGLPGGQARVRADISSQYLSALLLAAPHAHDAVTLILDSTLVSQPYITMTLAVMKSFGVDVTQPCDQSYHVSPSQAYRGTHYAVEPDASAASYFWAAAAIAGGEVTVSGLTRGALQGDVGFCDCLQKMGCEVTHLDHAIRVRAGTLRGIEVDMNAISDTVQTLAVVALFAEGPTTITNVAHIRHKESNRISDLAAELRKLGAHVEEREDGLHIEPRPLNPAELDTYKDHRMAMSLALAGLRVPGIAIRDPGCTEKTYPRFFHDLEQVVSGENPSG